MDLNKLIIFINERMCIACDSCNSYHINGIGNQIRGAIWFYSGSDPGRINEWDDVERHLKISSKEIDSIIEKK